MAQQQAIYVIREKMNGLYITNFWLTTAKDGDFLAVDFRTTVGALSAAVRFKQKRDADAVAAYCNALWAEKADNSLGVVTDYTAYL